MSSQQHTASTFVRRSPAWFLVMGLLAGALSEVIAKVVFQVPGADVLFLSANFSALTGLFLGPLGVLGMLLASVAHEVVFHLGLSNVWQEPNWLLLANSGALEITSQAPGICACLAFRFVPSVGRSLTGVRSAAVLLTVAFVGSAVEALVGVEILSPAEYWAAFWIWTGSGVTSQMILLPPVLILARPDSRSWVWPIPGEIRSRPDASYRLRRAPREVAGRPVSVVTRHAPETRREGLQVLALVAGVTCLVIPFSTWMPESQSWLLLLYLGPVLWASYHFGMRGGLLTASASSGILLVGNAIFAWIGEMPPAHLGVVSVFTLLTVLSIVGAISGASQDKQARMSDDLLESEERFRFLSESAFEGILVSLRGKVVETNDRLAIMLGYEPGDLVDSEVLDHVAPAEREAVHSRMRLVDESPFESMALRKDGSIMSVETCSGSALHKGQRVIVTAMRDITERKLVERRLRHSEERYRIVAENISDVIMTMDLDLQMTFLSQSVDQLLGSKPDKLVGRSFASLMTVDAAQIALLSIQEELELEGVPGTDPMRSRTLDLDFISADGATAMAEIKFSFLRNMVGEPIGIMGVARDVSEWIQAQEALGKSEAQLRQSQRLEAIGQLAGGVAHDFNNLLTVIMGNVELLMKDMLPRDPHRKAIDEVHYATQRATALTSQLLAFSRRKVFAPEVLDFNSVIADTETMLQRLITEDIELSTCLADGLHPVRTDPGQLQQVLVNLCVNARDAMPGGGCLTVETTNVEVGLIDAIEHPALEPGSWVRLSVRDSGTGISADAEEHIFEPFFTTKEKGKGTGLGLSTVYGIVKQSSGTIHVQSQPGVGTTFEIYFPRAEKVIAEAQSSPETSRSMAGNESVLLVEDEDGVRSLARRILERNGYLVFEAEDGEEALEICDQIDGAVDILVTDVVMPHISGSRLAERITERYPHIRVLYVSGYAEGVIDVGGHLEPGTAFLEKPFSVDSLLRAVRSELDSED